MGSLYPHQPEGIRFLAERERAYLADDMGLGKSIQACVAAARVRSQHTLVIAPASTLPNWRAEWKRWGNDGLFAAVSYADARRLRGAQGKDWDVVILDEAHYCKNPKAKRTIRALEIAQEATHAWLLSGTPMPNHPGELFAPIQALWPEVLAAVGASTYRQWIDKFCQYKMVQYSAYGPPQPKFYGHKNLDLLRPHMADIMLRRRLTDQDLPPIRVDLHRLTPDAGFNNALAQAGMDSDRLRSAINAAETNDETSRLRRLLGEYKAPRIAEQIDRELTDRAYRKIVVLAYHHAVLDRFEEMLAHHNPVGFRGSTPVEQRQEAIDRFTNDPTVHVFIAQQTAAGVGINLQAATEIVLVEPAWSPDDNAQAIKRIHRLGQDRPCRARIFAVAGSLDEGIMETVQRKLRTQRSLGLK